MGALKAAGKKPHVLAVPYPAQGHVRPMMKFGQKIANCGVKVTLVLTEYVHAKVVAAMSEDDLKQNPVQLITVSDGLPPDYDRNGERVLKPVMESLRKTMPGDLTRFIDKNIIDHDENITCVIADSAMGWILNVTQEMGLESVVFRPNPAACMALNLHIPHLIQAKHLDINGSIRKSDGLIKVSENIPPWRSHDLSWSNPDDLKTQKKLFEGFMAAGETGRNAKWVLVNTFYELEKSACDLIPNGLPIGPLLITTDHEEYSKSSTAMDGNFFSTEDMTCLRWLDEQPAGSVIYVSFGSTSLLSQDQLYELALALELSGRPFLWVVRSDLVNGTNVKFPNGFRERVAERAKVVEWAPQEKVLAHSSIACFFTHCGWNSFLEGLSMGLPFLCWPYHMDQFHNENYICEAWKIGLRLNPDENGLRSRYEIMNKIEMLLSDESIKANAMKLKEIAFQSVSESGSSSQNFRKFIDYLKNRE